MLKIKNHKTHTDKIRSKKSNSNSKVFDEFFSGERYVRPFGVRSSANEEARKSEVRKGGEDQSPIGRPAASLLRFLDGATQPGV